MRLVGNLLRVRLNEGCRFCRKTGFFRSLLVDDSIRRELDRRFPTDQYPVDIDVIGSQNAFPTIRVTNFDSAINVSKKANLEDFGFDTLAAVIETAKHMIRELEEAGTLRKL